MLKKRRILVAKIESSEGTAETLSGSDGGILAIDPKLDPDIAMGERAPAMATMSRLQSVPLGGVAKLTFKAEIKGAGSAYSSNNTPALGKYFRACGFLETINTTSSAEKATYTPASTGAPSLTMALYEDGMIKKMIGARGTVKISVKTGEIAYAEFDFTGVWGGATDGALVSPTYEGTIPPVFLNSTLTVGGHTMVVAGIDFNLESELKPRNDPTAASGYRSVAIVGRKATGKFDPEMETVASHDFFGLWKAGTAAALVMGPVGSTQYNRFKITAPKLAYAKVSDADRGGIAVADTAFELAMNSGDDEIVIEFS